VLGGAFTVVCLLGLASARLPAADTSWQDGPANLVVATSAPVTVVVNARPVISLSRTHFLYPEASGPVLLDEAAAVSDADSPNFDEGTLTIEFVANGFPEDRLAIRNQGANAGRISIFDGNHIRYDALEIGTFEGGTNGSSPLVIRFGGKATATAVTALLRNLTYENVSSQPSSLPRLVRLVLDDGDGGYSAPVWITIDVRSVNDAPMAIARVLNLVHLRAGLTDGFIISPNNSNGLVVLDGSLSRDVENDPLTFTWFRDGGAPPFAAGATVSNLFSVDSHTVLLVVDDGQDSGTARLDVEVITPGMALEEVLLLLAGSNLPRDRSRPLVATLKAAMASFDRGDFTSPASQLRAFQNKVRAQVAPANPALAASLNQAVEQILNAIGL
jgi:hypothetical protein